MKVPLRHQHRHPVAIRIEKILAAVELIYRPNLLDRSVGQFDTVAPARSQHHFRFQRPFDMQMQFGLGQSVDKGANIHKTFQIQFRDSGIQSQITDACNAPEDFV